MAEGGNINRPPLFDGSNYAYWKARMRAFLIAIDERVWQSIEIGWKHPTEKVDNVETPKPRSKWTKDENESSSFNGKGINALFNALSQTEFTRVSACETAKEIWDTLQVTHEGTSLVKVQKLQMLTSKFDSISMDENETFTEYYTRLQDVVNTCANLGEKIPESKVIRKILRTLPERFRAKVAAIETIKHPDEMKVEELVGALQTYEMTFPTNQSSSKSFSKSTGIALKSTKEEEDDMDSDGNITLADFEHQLALLTKKFRRNFRKNNASSSKRKSFSKPSSNSKLKDKKLAKSSYEKDEFEGEIQCFKCRGYGHIATDCPSKKTYKSKALQAKTWDDSTSDDSSPSDEEKDHIALISNSSLPSSSNVACLSSIVSNSNVSPSSHGSSSENEESEEEANDEDIEEANDEDIEEANDEDIAEAYNQLLSDSKKMVKFNKKLESRLLEIEEDNNNIRIKNEALKEERESMLKKKTDLQKKLEEAGLTIKSYMDKIGFLEQQFKETYKSNQELTNQVRQLQSDLQKFSSGSKKLDHMLGLGQTNKVGLGYERTYVEKDQKTTSKVSTTLNEKVCHRCGIKGHIKRSCPRKSKKNQLATRKPQLAPSSTRRPPRNQKMNQVSRASQANRFSNAQRQYQPKNQPTKPSPVDQKSKKVKPHVDKPKPKIRQVWIRKGDIFPCSSS